MRKNFFVVFLLITLFFRFVPLTANAETVPYFTYSLDAQSAAPDELVKLKINANQMPDTAAGFRMIVNYDDTVLSFVRTETSSQIKSGTMMTNSASNPIYSVYVCDVNQNAAPVLSGNIISFVFKVKNDADEGKTVIGAHIDQVCNYQANQLGLNYDEDLTLNIETDEDPSGNAFLTMLDPLKGRLIPDFSSDVFDYSMNVGYDVKTVEFEAAAGDSGTVKINRKTLGRAGTDTDIIVTVTSANKKVKEQYVVTVHRDETPDIAAESTEGKPAPQKTAAVSKPTEIKSGAVTENQEYQPSPQRAETGNANKTVWQSTDGTPVAAGQIQQVSAGRDGRSIYIIGNQMPTYVVLLLVAVVLVQLGMLLSFWLNIKPKR